MDWRSTAAGAGSGSERASCKRVGVPVVWCGLRAGYDLHEPAESRVVPLRSGRGEWRGGEGACTGGSGAETAWVALLPR